MDQERFDALTERVMSQLTRRNALGLLGGVVGGTLLFTETEATRRRKRRGRKGGRGRTRGRGGRGRGRSQSTSSTVPVTSGTIPASSTQPSSDVCSAAGTKQCLATDAIRNASVSGCDFSNAQMYKRDMNGATASKANFSNANLRKADMSNMTLNSACLTHADLCDADLSQANLSHADLCGANLKGVTYDQWQTNGVNLCCSTIMPDGNPAIACTGDTRCCEDACIDVSGDVNNCGWCGNTCAAGEICCDGGCVAAATCPVE